MSNPSITTRASVDGGLSSVGATQGTALAPRFYEGPMDIQGDVQLHQRFFAYKTDPGWVTGKTFNVMFTIDRPGSEVWPHLKDFNPWQNSYGHYYSGVIGDLDGATVLLGSKPNDTEGTLYNVVRVVPEHLIVLMQPAAEEKPSDVGLDCHVFMLNEYSGKSIVTCLMEHSSLYKGRTEEEALRPWREVAPESQRKWRDIFIPQLKKVVAARS